MAHFAYAPVVLDLRTRTVGRGVFPLARNNPIAGVADGAVVKIGIMGSHAYVSPDWYETPDQVPTWNYMAVEGAGRRATPRRCRHGDVSDASVGGAGILLAPKPPWSPARLQPDRLKQLMQGIVAFRLPFDTLEGKAKLSQNRSQADIIDVIAALRRRGDETGTALASAMQDLSLR